MNKATGLLKQWEEKGSYVLTINDVPIAKMFEECNGKEISLSIFLHDPNGHEQLLHQYTGQAEIFFFSGTQLFYSGTKFVNDFLIDDEDIIEVLEKYENRTVTIFIEDAV